MNYFDFDAYDHRPEYFRDILREKWGNWIWQQQQAIQNVSALPKIFPNFPQTYLQQGEVWQQRGFRFLFTPYVLALVQKDNQGNPFPTDPVWRQIFPVFDELMERSEDISILSVYRPDEYSSRKENWEKSPEMVTPIAQHKYANRIIIYTSDVCLGYCMYCFRSLQSNAPSEKHGGHPFWRETLEAIAARPQVEEVILSGGDPLIYDNVHLEKMLKDLRAIPHVKAIRIHTRAWLFNPYRLDEEFCALLKKYAVTEMQVHIVHSQEMTKNFQEAVEKVRKSGARTILLTDTPLIKGVNDDVAILHDLFMNLYLSGIKPYYLSHNMPNIPAAASQRTSVRRGLELYSQLKRHISNTAMPEYIICDQSGKKTVPECLDGTPDFRYEQDENGWSVVRFRNWKGEWETYVDGVD